MKQVNKAQSQSQETAGEEPGQAPSVLSPEAWDRRGHDPRSGPAIECLVHAARHLIFDQMRPDRTYLPGAQDAVHLLWQAMLAVDAARVTRERVERLSSIWLPQQIVARARGNGPSSH